MLRLLDTNQLMWMTRRSRLTIYSWIRDGKLPNPNVSGKPLRWTESAIRDWIENLDPSLTTECPTLRLQKPEPLNPEVLRQRLNQVIAIDECLKQQQASTAEAV